VVALIVVSFTLVAGAFAFHQMDGVI